MERRRVPVGMITVIGVVMTVAALKLASTICIPVVISVFLAFMLMPVVRGLSRIKVPLGLASFLSLLLVVGLAWLGGLLIQTSLTSFIEELPGYSKKVKKAIESFLAYLESRGYERINEKEIMNSLDPREIVDFVTSTAWWGASAFFGFASNLLLIFFITLFMLMETERFKETFVKAYGKDSVFPSSVEAIGREIQRYMGLKTVISFATGSVVYMFLNILNVPFALLWGGLTFALNFIPTIGSIIAGIFPVLVSILQFGDPWKVLAVILGLLAIQLTIGGYLDPRVMGNELRLSTLVVFLSMFFFGWLWGFVGTILGVPIVVSLKVVFTKSKNLKPLATILEG